MTRKLAILLMLMTLGWGSVLGQSVESLRKDIERDRQELSRIEGLLQKNTASKKSSERELKLIRNTISGRRKVIRKLDNQINALVVSVERKQQQLSQGQKRLESLRREYAGYIYEGYKSSLRGDALTFLLSARDFNDANRRLGYMRRAAEARRQTAAEIDSISTVLAVQIEELGARKQELSDTRSSRQKELKTLRSDESTQQKKVAQLTSTEKNLKSKANAARKKIEQAQRKINSLIADETKKKSGRTQAQIDADVILSGQFGQNKGKMPYPVRGGVIIDHFGRQNHHLYSNMVINNGGINIAGQAGDPVKCVFDGEVRTILSLANLGQNTAVLVRHGDYFTVYQNIVNVSVKVGDKVTINQTIGTLPTVGTEDDHYLHFEIWQNNQKLNPEYWLNR
ncbi:MAG: peptidoglycan DD-metalloendopeptidase family protein [Rikenellaceae bacterium]|nr:peptidoglycan DD-metalloendopeptidase family protein [Rikenellaceae bacterium]